MPGGDRCAAAAAVLRDIGTVLLALGGGRFLAKESNRIVTDGGRRRA
jgi:hypothetical protein